MSLNKKHLILLALVTLTTGVSLRMTSILGDGSAFEVAGGGPVSIPKTVVSVELNTSKLNMSNAPTTIKYRSPSLYVDNIVSANRLVELNANTRLNMAGGSYFLFPGYGYSSYDFCNVALVSEECVDDNFAEDALYTISESGSDINKYRLTKIIISGSRRVLQANSGTTQAPTDSPVTINLSKVTSSSQGEEGLPGTLTTTSPILVGSFNSTTVPTNSDSDLNLNTFTSIEKSFDYELDIKTFRLTSSRAFFFSSITFEYSIDYSVC
jgi:hypothetical protein